MTISIIKHHEILDLLMSLAEKSLINLNSSNNQVGFSLLESVAYYSTSKAKEIDPGDEAKTINNHIMHYYNESDKFNTLMNSMQATDVIKAFNMLDGLNTEKALCYTKQAGYNTLGLKFTNNLHEYWIHKSNFKLGLNFQEYFLKSNMDKNSVELGRGYSNLSHLFFYIDHSKVIGYRKTSVDILNNTNDKHWLALSLVGYGFSLAENRNMDKAKDCIDKAHNIIEECNYLDLKSDLYLLKSFVCIMKDKDDKEEIKSNLEQSSSFLKYTNYIKRIFHFRNLGNHYCSIKEFTKAENFIKQSIQYSKGVKLVTNEVMVAHTLCSIYFETGRFEECEKVCDEYIPISRQLNMIIYEGLLTCVYSILIAKKGQLKKSIHLFNKSIDIFKTRQKIANYLFRYITILEILMYNNKYIPYIVIVYAHDKIINEMVPNYLKWDKLIENNEDVISTLNKCKENVSIEEYEKYSNLGQSMSLEDLENYCRELEYGFE